MLEHFNRTTGIITAISLAVIIWILGVIIGQEQTITILNPDRDLKTILNRSPKIAVNLMLDYQDGRIRVFPEVPLTYGQSVFNLLDRLKQNPAIALAFEYNLNKQTGQLESFSLGGLVNLVDGPKWQLWLNNNLQTKGLTAVKLKAGDIVELKYIKLRE
jgi:hypothetical protein